MNFFVIPRCAIAHLRARVSACPESIYPLNPRLDGFRARDFIAPEMTASAGDEDDFFTGIE
ncbi:hypothetical protein [Bradyrhizobium viridifuturi]|uniref:hypothetical protein n=1 Tax=Bradyrhizobium viridifuturi TaxID=1654716 RepID=UPI00067F5AEE|nr:hypothetical protein [Bradyrhizobium viridifuturi]